MFVLFALTTKKSKNVLVASVHQNQRHAKLYEKSTFHIP